MVMPSSGRRSRNAFRLRPRSRVLREFALTALLAAGLGSVAALADSDHNNSGPSVSTVDGAVRGFTKNGVNIFLGIPYAAPPVGNLRWQPPQPVKRWKGTLDASQYGNTCPQVTELGAFAGPSSVSEDCLYLNVFTTGASKNGKKKPVIVWIHGGGNIDGETNDYDASKLAAGGPDGTATVVVTLNYRLGLLGFYSHPALNKEGHLWGNYGILDQQAALRWVQRNIAAFGGDPNKVALGGQSAGAQDTGANQVSPYSSGLFTRAIYQSSPGFFSTLPSADTALTRGKNFATAAGCSGSNAAAAKCLRDLPASRILQLQGTPNADGPYTAGLFVDGTIIPMTPEQAFSSGKFNKTPIMGGAVKDELTFQTGITEYFSGPPQAPMTADQYNAAVTGPAAAEYPLSSFGGDPMLAYERYLTDPNKCRELHVIKLWAPQVPTYAYDFTYQDAESTSTPAGSRDTSSRRTSGGRSFRRRTTISRTGSGSSNPSSIVSARRPLKPSRCRAASRSWIGSSASRFRRKRRRSTSASRSRSRADGLSRNSRRRQSYGDHCVFSNVDFIIERGERVALVGVNGAGKSTLIKILAGAEPVTAGDYTLGHNAQPDYFAQNQ